MKKRTLAVGGALLTTSLLLSGCAGGGGAADNSSRTDLEVVLPAQPTSLDPHISNLIVTTEITRPIYETLLAVDENFEIRPDLAESYERSEDGLTFTFHLRDGVKFHDDSDLDATDVVASMERWTKITVPGQELFPGATWTMIDPLTVELKVTEPSFLHEVNLSSRSQLYPAIMPSEVVEAAGEDSVADIIGSGPYEFVDWQADQFVKIKKWDGYQPGEGETSGWVGDKTGIIEDITFNFVADPSTRTLGLQSGQYDIAPDFSYDGLEQVKADENLQVGSYMISPQIMVFGADPASPVANVDFRQALDTAFDRDAIMMAAVGDPELYDLVHHTMSRERESVWNTEVGKANFNSVDIEKAKSLLKKSGYDGRTLKLTVTRDYPEAYNSAVVVQAQLQELGVPVELEAMEWGAYAESLLGDPTGWDISVAPAVTAPEPSGLSGFMRDMPGYIPSERFDKLMEDYFAKTTLEDATAFYDEMQQYIEDVRPVIKLGDASNIYAANKSLGDVPAFDSSIRWWAVSYAQ